FDLNWSLNYLIRKGPGIELPELTARGFDWQRGWSDSWNDTVEGQAYLGTLPHYFVRLAHDGEFGISGVLTGEHQLGLRISEHKDAKAWLVNPVRSRIGPVQISEEDVGKGAVDLGRMLVDAVLGPDVGAEVPDFSMERAAGPKVNLSDFRGQYVLLDFWASW